jgi:cell division protein FtsB
MIHAPRNGPTRTPSDDCGYRETAARRERLLAAASPAVRAHILGTPPDHASTAVVHRITVDIAKGERTIDRDIGPRPPDAAQRQAVRLRREIGKLQQRCEALRGEVEQLRRQAAVDCEVADVARQFLVELARVGYAVDGEPVTLGDLRGLRRARPWSRPRMAAMWLCSQVARRASLPEVGRHFARDRATVVHARREIVGVLQEAPALRAAARATCTALGIAVPAILESARAGAPS